MRKLLTVLGAAFLVALLSVPASADTGPACTPIPNGNGAATCSLHIQDVTMANPVAPIACPDGSTVPGGFLVTTIANGVLHFTVDKAQDFWGTSTVEGTFVFTATDGTAYTGHFTEWFGVSVNNQNSVQHATINFVGMSASGAHLSIHAEFHVSMSASGELNMFFETHC
jgi:hypothetical protein